MNCLFYHPSSCRIITSTKLINVNRIKIPHWSKTYSKQLMLFKDTILCWLWFGIMTDFRVKVKRCITGHHLGKAYKHFSPGHILEKYLIISRHENERLIALLIYASRFLWHLCGITQRISSQQTASDLWGKTAG